MAKAFKDPTQVIAPVMPFPIEFAGPQGRGAEHQQERGADDQTGRAAAAREPITTTTRRIEVTRSWTKAAKLAAAVAVAMPLTGCISVKAPDKPIDINLNVNIRQEVLVRLQQDVQQMIQQNPQAFPPRADAGHER